MSLVGLKYLDWNQSVYLELRNLLMQPIFQLQFSYSFGCNFGHYQIT